MVKIGIRMLLCGLSFAFTGCQWITPHQESVLETTSQDALQLKFEQLLAKHGASIKDGYYLLIPVDGCHVCVDSCAEFAKKNEGNPKINFIVTSDKGAKPIMNKFSPADTSATNFIIDLHADFIREGYTNGFMMLVRVLDQKMGAVQQLQPDIVNRTLNELQKEL